jgi:hypothetical protein
MEWSRALSIVARICRHSFPTYAASLATLAKMNALNLISRGFEPDLQDSERADLCCVD